MSFPTPDGPPVWAPPPPPLPPQSRPPQSRWIAPVSLAIAVIATAVAVWALVRSAPVEPTPPSAQAISDAKARVCSGYTSVSKAVTLQTHANLGTDPVALAAVAANARLAMSEGATYLLARIDPAAPTDLADEARRFAEDLQSISMGALAGHANTEAAQMALLNDAEKTGNRIEAMCE